MDNLLFKRILITVLILALMSYVGFLFLNANFSNTVDYDVAVKVTTADTIRTKGFFVRDEEYIKNKNGGVLSYNVNNGDNVSVGQNIASVYSNESDAVAQQKIESLNKQIKVLEVLNNFYHKGSVGIDTINSQIDSKIISMLGEVNNNKFTSAQSNTDNLLYYINERQIVTGQIKSFKSKINDLKSQKDEIERTCSPKTATVTADKAGYYISSVDGYEKSFKIQDLNKVTTKELSDVKKSAKPRNVIGKVVVDPQWYILCEVDNDQAISLSKLQGLNSKVSLTIPFISKKNIQASIYSINRSSKSKNAVLVLSCDFMSKEISSARSETMEINTKEYSGLKIEKRAIHEDYVTKTVEKENGDTVTKRKKVQGVYVLYGSELIFKEIYITFSSKQYVLCNPNPDEGLLFNGTTVKMYDQVVIKGDNLYNGKVIA